MPAYNFYGGNYGNPYLQGGFYQAGYPTQPVQQPTVPQTPQMTVPQTVQSPTVPQIQNGGFITVRSEAEARAYPVAPGTSVTFKHETAPYCYTKTMGFSQFEAPRFEKFKLVKEEDTPEAETSAKEKPQETVAYATQEDLGKIVGVVQGLNDLVGNIKTDVESMKSDMYGIAGQKKKSARKVEANADDDA